MKKFKLVWGIHLFKFAAVVRGYQDLVASFRILALRETILGEIFRRLVGVLGKVARRPANRFATLPVEAAGLLVERQLMAKPDSLERPVRTIPGTSEGLLGDHSPLPRLRERDPAQRSRLRGREAADEGRKGLGGFEFHEGLGRGVMLEDRHQPNSGPLFEDFLDGLLGY